MENGSFSSYAIFNGKLHITDFYLVLEKIDILKKIGYIFVKHEREDFGDYVQFDYKLELYNI